MNIDPRVIRIIQEDPTQRKFFLRKVKDRKWFGALKEIGVFNTDALPPREGVDEVGRRIGLEWEPLPYLIELAKYVTEANDYELLGRELIEIIKEIGLKDRGNFITRNAVLKILQALPNCLLDRSVVGIIAQWILDGERGSFFGPEVSDEFLKKLACDESLKSEAEQLFVALTSLHIPEEPEVHKIFQSTDCSFCIDPYWIRTGLEKHRELIAQSLGIEVYCDLKKKIEFLLLRNAERNPKSDTMGDHNVQLQYSENKLVFSIRNEQNKEVFYKTFSASSPREAIVSQFISDCLKQSIITEETRNDFVRLFQDLHLAIHHEQTYVSFRHERHIDNKDPLELLPWIFRSLLSERMRFRPEETRNLLSGLLDETFLIFPKIVLHLIGEHPTELKELFWVALKSSNKDVILDSLFFGDELNYVLGALPPLNDNERKSIQDAIDSGANQLNCGEDEEHKVLWKQQRYKALSKDSYFLSEYNKLKKITQRDWDLGPAIGQGETRSGPGPSGISIEKLLSFDTRQIVQHLTEFKPSSSWDGPSIGGLAATLENAVAYDPEHFTHNLNPFLNTAYIWIGRVVRGFYSAKRLNKSIDWDSIVTFLEKLTASDDFWDGRLPVLSDEGIFKPNSEWVLGDIAGLIEVMIENDNLLVQPETVSRFKNVIHKSLLSMDLPEGTSSSEPVMQAINSTIGRMLEAYLRTILYQARNHLILSKAKIRWEDSDKLLFNYLLQRGVSEVWTIAGMFFPNLAYLDSEWAEDLAKNRVINLGDILWFHFFTGYLHHSRFYDVTYEWMRESYSRAIAGGQFDDASRRRLSEHLTLAYLRNHEDLDKNSLIDRFLAEASLDQIQEALSFIEDLSVDISKDGKTDSVSDHNFAPRVLTLWRKIDGKLADSSAGESEERRQTVSLLAGLTRFLPTIDDSSFALLRRAISNFASDQEHPFFLEHLIYQKDHSRSGETRQWVGLVILELLKVCTPSFRKEDIVELVQWLYEGRETNQIASEICNIYARRGSDFLVELYRKYKRSADA